MADGELIFDAKINTKGFNQGTGDITKDFRKTADAVSTSNSKITKSTAQVAKAMKDRTKIAKELRRAESQKAKQVTTPQGISSVSSVNLPKASDFTEQAQGIKWADDELKTYYKSLKMAQAEIARLQKTSEASYANMEAQIKKMYQAELQSLKRNKAYKNMSTKDLENQADANLMLKQSYQNLLASQGKIESNLRKLNKEYANNEQRLKFVVQENNKLVETQSEATQAIKTNQREMKKTENDSNSLGKAIHKLGKRFTTLIKLMVIRAVLREVLNGFKDLARYSNDFNSTMSSLQGSFLTLRNSLSVAFAPILESLAPMITQISDALTNMFNKMAMYTTALFTNKKTVLQAKKVTTDYAKSLGNVEDGAKEASKALADFDEISKLEETTVANSGLPSASEMFEEVAIPADVLNGASKIKELYEELKPLLITVGALAGGLFVADEITKLTDWLKKIGLIKDATDNLTDSMKGKNKVLGDQTTQTAKETAKVLQWGLALGGAGVAVWGLKNVLDNLKQSFPLELPFGEVGSFGTAMQEAFAKAKNAVKLWKENIVSDISIVAQKLLDGTYFENFKENARNAFENAKNAVIQWKDNTVENLKTAFTSMATACYDGLYNMAENITNFVNNTSVGFANWGMNLITNIGKTMKSWYETFVDGLVSAWEQFVDFMAGIGEAITSWFSANKNWIIPTVATGVVLAGLALAPATGGLSLLPALATGTVVPANNGEFTAILGDNKKEPEIVSPLSTMKQALREVVAETDGIGSNKNITVILELNKREFGRAVYQANNQETQRVGLSFRKGVMA